MMSVTAVRRTIRILGLDGARVYDRLLNAALAEVEWQDLKSNPRKAINSPRPINRAGLRATMLFDKFLDACSNGPNEAMEFLDRQHQLQREHLQQSLKILESLQQSYSDDQVRFAALAFAAQIVKSLSTVGIAFAGLLLDLPFAIAGSVLALGYDLALAIVSRVEPRVPWTDDAVIVGFKQTMANDSVGVVGATQQVRVDVAKKALERTLRYPPKSSKFRSLAREGSGLDKWLKVFGSLAAAVTLYSEGSDVLQAWKWKQSQDLSRHPLATPQPPSAPPSTNNQTRRPLLP